MSSARQLFDDLLTLETNTVIKPEMTARKPFSLAESILETIDAYQLHLVGVGVQPPEGATRPEGTLQEIDGAGLRSMARAAKLLVLDPAGIVDDPGTRDSVANERVLLTRIANNCIQIDAVLGRAKVQTLRAGQTLELPPDDVARIRKIWDLGLEMVVIQSVMQIDGDYVTRVPSSAFLESNPGLLELHGQMLGRSVDHYGSLIEAASQLLRSFASFFLK